MTSDAYMNLTPTEELIIDNLVARYRLGENIWTFSSRVRRQVESLAAKGLVNSMNGVIEYTCRASLTELGKQTFMSEEYVPPILRTE